MLVDWPLFLTVFRKRQLVAAAGRKSSHGCRATWRVKRHPEYAVPPRGPGGYPGVALSQGAPGLPPVFLTVCPETGY